MSTVALRYQSMPQPRSRVPRPTTAGELELEPLRSGVFGDGGATSPVPSTMRRPRTAPHHDGGSVLVGGDWAGRPTSPLRRTRRSRHRVHGKVHVPDTLRLQADMLPEWVGGCLALRENMRAQAEKRERENVWLALGFRASRILRAWQRAAQQLEVARRWFDWADRLWRLGGKGMLDELVRRYRLLRRALLRMGRVKLAAGWRAWREWLQWLAKQRWRRLAERLWSHCGAGLMAEAVRRWRLLRRILLRMANGKLASAFSTWRANLPPVDVRPDWMRFAAGLWQRTSVGMINELLRRWRLVRKVVFRLANVRLAAGFAAWREWKAWYARQRLLKLAEKWWLACSVGLMREVIRRWRLIRKILLRIANLKLASAWRAWQAYLTGLAAQRWYRLAEKWWLVCSVGLMREVIRRWRLIRKTLLRMANLKLASGFAKWAEPPSRSPRLRLGQCTCVYSVGATLRCRCSANRHLLLRVQMLRGDIDTAMRAPPKPPGLFASRKLSHW